jgi:hypothetical protein
MCRLSFVSKGRRVLPACALSLGAKSAMSHLLSLDSYERIARTLPRPTAAQRARFLDYIAAARPWAMLLPADGGVPFTLLLNPQAGRPLSRDRASRIGPGHPEDDAGAVARYRASFGHLDYAAPVARGGSVLTGADLGLAASYYVLDAQGCAVALPAGLMKAASCTLNAALHPDPVQLLETLPLRVPQVFDAGGDRLDPIDTDAELRAFAEEYTREELGGFVCPTDREAWASRWLESFGRLYAPRHAEQRAQLERALAGLLTWLDLIDKD